MILINNMHLQEVFQDAALYTSMQFNAGAHCNCGSLVASIFSLFSDQEPIIMASYFDYSCDRLHARFIYFCLDDERVLPLAARGGVD